MSERLQKLLARHGFGSRRQIEDWMLAGRVLLNGAPAQPGDRFSPGDRLSVDGKDVTAKLAALAPSRILAYHKAPGEVLKAEEDGATLLDRLPSVRGSRWLAINPMNAADSGLLLLANDGRLVNALKRRSPSIRAVYMVRVHVPGREAGALPDLQTSVRHDERDVVFAAVEPAGGEGANLWYRVVAEHADRRAAVRSLFEAQGLKVSRLMQVGYGAIELPRELARGRHRDLTVDQIAGLYALTDIAAVEDKPASRRISRGRSAPARRRTSKQRRSR